MARPARRALASLAVVLAVATAGGMTGDAHSSELQEQHYRDQAGWSLAYPESMFLERSGARLRAAVSEVTIASFPPRAAVRSGSSAHGSWWRVDRPLDMRGAFPSDAVAFRVVRAEGGAPPDLESAETRFRLDLASFHASDQYPNAEPRPLEQSVVANGRTYTALAWIGEKAAPELRASLERVVSSLAFPSLHPGTLVGDGFTVLKLESRYPLALFTRVRAQGVPFYLVHAPGGFYGVGWRWETLTGGYKSRCRLQLDPRHREFFCTNMRARWDRVGRVLVRPRGAARGDPLNLAVAKVAWDGHVLLHAGTARFADSRLARELWPRWKRG
jgi:hypothetical protein